MGLVPGWKDIFIALQVLFALGIFMYAGAYICKVGREKDKTGEWRWVLPHANPCGCHKIVMGGVNTRTPIRPFEPKYVDSPLISENIDEIRKHYKIECNAVWSGFGDWDSCTTTCGNGSQSRGAICVIPEFTHTSCEGTPPIETRKCNNSECPTWGAWGNWSHCSTTCDSGTQYRQKECNQNGHPTAQCNGTQPVEDRDCNEGKCPTWGIWGTWVECSTTCGNGTQYRKKECNKYDHPTAQCNGEQPEEYRDCSGGKCPTWGAWETWSDCSATCDSGTEYRKKECNKYGQPTAQCNGTQPVEDRDCNEGKCPTWGIWGTWVECSTTCNTGTQYRKKECNKYDHPTAQCNGEQPEEYRDCSGGKCPTWGAWETWSDCSATCDSGTEYRKKECNKYGQPTAQCNGTQPVEDRDCNAGKCPYWGDWNPWSKCDHFENVPNCQISGQQRYRMCDNTLFPKATCSGNPPMEHQCNCHCQEDTRSCRKVNDYYIVYQLFKESKSYEKARGTCADQYSVLTSIVDQEEQDFLKKFLQGINVNENVWIGLNDMGTENKWMWEDGTQFNYTYWGNKEPNDSDGKEDCAHLTLDTSKRWNDHQCCKTFMFICKTTLYNDKDNQSFAS